MVVLDHKVGYCSIEHKEGLKLFISLHYPPLRGINQGQNNPMYGMSVFGDMNKISDETIKRMIAEVSQ